MTVNLFFESRLFVNFEVFWLVTFCTLALGMGCGVVGCKDSFMDAVDDSIIDL